MKYSAFLATVLLLIMQGCRPSPTNGFPGIGKATALSPTSTLPPSSTPTAVPTQTPLPSPTHTATLTATATEIPWPTSTPGPTPQGGSELVLVSLSARSGEAITDRGVLLVDLVSGNTRTILGEGFRLQSIAPDGSRLLVSRGSELWIARLDGVLQAQITGRLFAGGTPTALWAEGGLQIAMIEAEEDTRRINFVNASGYQRVPYGADDGTENAIALYPAGSGRLAWEYGDCQGEVCTPMGSRLSMAEGAPVVDLPGKFHPLVSPTGEFLAYSYYDDEHKSRLGVMALEKDSDRQLDLAGDHLMAYAWDPSGERLSVLNLERSDYSGRWFGINHFLVSIRSWSVRELKQVAGVNAQTYWSPDGTLVLAAGTFEEDTGYQVRMTKIVPDANRLEEVTLPEIFSGEDFLLLNKLIWISR